VTTSAARDATPDVSPPRSGLVLAALVLGAVTANINLGIANVALPTIGAALHATQTQLTAIGAAFALGLASSVLWFGAIGDRYGRKLNYVLGAAASIPTALMAAYSPNPETLIVARYLGGLAAGLLFPTTLSLITALFEGKPRVRAIALWSGLGGAVAAVGPIVAGWLLESYWWGSVFLVTLPLAATSLVLGLFVLPWHAHEEGTSVDHLGGALSVVAVATLVLAVNIAPQGLTAALGVLLAISAAAWVLFLWRQRRAPRPLVALPLLRPETFWVAFVAGMVTFGSLIGAMFIGQQFTQNVLGDDPLRAAVSALPMAVMMAVCGQLAGRMLLARGGRSTFSIGLVAVALGFVVMLFTWHDGTWYGWVYVGYALVGTGVGFSATPASRAIMSSIPVSRAGMGSAFLDLTRDFGGAIMQSAMGALLATVYATYFAQAFASLPPAQAQALGQDAANEIASSYAGAEQVAQGFPQATADQIVQAAATAFTEGKSAAMGLGLVATLVALVLVVWKYPRHAAEEEFYAQVAAGLANVEPPPRPE
jgi:EmrB/QacA subfamily drug resistance transporter